MTFPCREVPFICGASSYRGDATYELYTIYNHEYSYGVVDPTASRMMVTQHRPEIIGLTWMYDGISGRTTYLLFATSLGGFILWLIANLARRAFRNSNLPPGPRGFPLIGDVRHMSDNKWLASPQRRDDYGGPILVMFREACSCTSQVK